MLKEKIVWVALFHVDLLLILAIFETQSLFSCFILDWGNPSI
jgi:hypothetical protein